ncbi:MAG: class II glutamine amidotransferase [Immundisolibacteraceae bacterium]|nr:class II glutamine amidotransferase [Immundisolibacteraceae bacterium]
MCELLGMSANVPTDITFSFAGLMQRGGATGPHRDGWGISFYEGKGYRDVHDPEPSADSKLARFMQGYPIKSHTVICHIRKANRGRVCLENTHPFSRELWGQTWSFAHNGQLKGIKKWPLQHYLPVGTTDSEHAFCWLLDQIRRQFPTPPRQRKKLWTFIEAQADTIATLGVFNILMSDSKSLYSHCSTKLAWLTRQAPFGDAQLLDAEMTVDFAQETQPNDVVTVIATQPLTKNEPWQPMHKNQFTVFQQGKVAYQSKLQ